MVYTERVTMMEMLCASILQPSMISMQLSCYGHDLKRKEAHMQEHRTGARGNFTAFELPWSDIFKSLSEPVPLPQTGKRLRKLVQVILMTDGKGDGVDATPPALQSRGAAAKVADDTRCAPVL